jgi:hypothetical protein
MHMSTIEMVAKAIDTGSISLIFLVMRRLAAPIVVWSLLEAKAVFFRTVRLALKLATYPAPPKNICFFVAVCCSRLRLVSHSASVEQR